MRKIIAISKCLLRLLFRAGTAWGMLLAAAGIAAFIFFNAKADDTLLHELQIRLRYSLVFAVVFLSFGMLFLACTAMRRDIDEKLMHMLTAYPIGRWQIWAGKWLGLLALGLLIVAAIFLSTGVAAAVFLQQWARPAETTAALREFSRVLRMCPPRQTDLNEQATAAYQDRLAAGGINTGVPKQEAIQEIARDLRRKEQLLAPNSSKEWLFDLGQVPRLGPHLMLDYTVYAENRRQQIRGTWKLEAVDEPQSVTLESAAYPYVKTRLVFPLETVPAGGRVRLVFTGKDTPYLIFPWQKSVFLLYDNGSLWLNLGRLTLVLTLHLAAVAAIGLAAGTVFTLPVAAFVSLIMYLVAVCSDFFQNVAGELHWGEGNLPAMLSATFLQAGLWISSGLRLPPVISDFSEGQAIAFDVLWRTAGSGFIIYLLLIVTAGIYWLSRKELDRLH